MKRRTKLFRLFCFVILGIVCGGVLAGGASGSDAGALGYKRYQRIDFTFEPTLKLILSSNDLVIPNLNVDSSSDSNIISIETGTNVATGMQLTATVGRDDSAEHVGEEGYEDPYNTTSLVNGENSFAALSGSAASLDSSDFGVNKWGYAYSTDNGTTWVNGDSNNTSNGYNGLPIHSGTGVKIVDTSDKVDANLQFKIGAKASIAQAAGEYTNIINFYAVTKVATTDYTVTYIDESGKGTNMPPSSGDITSGQLTSDGGVQISSTVPIRDDIYYFVGWCTSETNKGGCPNGNVYQPGEYYPISNVGGNIEIKLYAMWGVCTGPNALLYCAVASNSKGTQTIAGLQTGITTSNSGVYEYNSSVFGDSSDMSSDYPIYYYRGILDNSFASSDANGDIGSSGDGTLYPNYVILDADGTRTTTDTCWRIVRTTGSGGVKMVFSGFWDGAGGTCAHATTTAQITTSPFNTTSSKISGKTYEGLQAQNIHAVGYTYSTLAAGTDTSTAISTIFGSSGNDTTTNSKSSIIKQFIEDWYASNLLSYDSILEPSAGYCNDRSIGTSASWTTALSDSDTIIPYGTASMTVYYFGAYTRNLNAVKPPSLGCTRGVVDLYSTTVASGGNGQLVRPIALLTADEVSFAGSGRSTPSQGSSYHVKSYLRSGSGFWLLSPYYRYSGGGARGFRLRSNGYLDYHNVSYSNGVRPAISLSHGTNISSGSGTAADPWVINAPTSSSEP